MAFAQYDLWTIGTAKTLPHKQFEIGVFSPLRYGITRFWEVQTFHTFDALFPNIRTKIHWLTIKKLGLLVATRHGFCYPTPGIKYIHENEPFGIEWFDFYPGGLHVRRIKAPLFSKDYPVPLDYVPMNETQIPKIYTFANELLLSRMMIPKSSCKPADMFVTLKLGIAFSKFDGERSIPQVIEPILYSRSTVLHDSVLWYVGLDIDGHLNAYLDYCVDFDFYSVDWDVKDYSVEHKGLIIFPIKRFSIVAGYKLAYGTYPDKNRLNFYPLLDITYRFGLYFRQNGLFRKSPYKRKFGEKRKGEKDYEKILDDTKQEDETGDEDDF